MVSKQKDGNGTTASRSPLLGTPQEALPVLALLIVTLATYGPVRGHDFVNYDDPDYVVRNSHIHSGLNWESLRWALTTTSQGNWHPLTWISHAIDCQFFGLNPSGPHLMNLGLHASSVLLLVWLLTSVTGEPRRSIVVAGLFALHPLNVESVAWIAERKNLLSTLFFLITLAAYSRYTRRPSTSRYLPVIGAFLLALASKPMVVTLPFVLLLFDYWPLQRMQGWTAPRDIDPLPQSPLVSIVLEKIPLLALAAASSVITVAAQGGAVMALDTFPISARLQNAVYSYVVYLSKAVFPLRLAVFYPHPGGSLAVWKVALSVAFLLAVTWGVWAARLYAPSLIVGWLWFVGTLVPVIGVVQVGAQAMADRYAYIPLIGIFVAAVWGIADLCKAHRVKMMWLYAAAFLVLAALSWITWRQVAYWMDSQALWSHALEVTSDNPFSEDQLGMALLAINRQEDAMKHFQSAIALGTHDPTGYLNLGAYLSEHGRYGEAIPMLDVGLSLARDTETRVLAHLDLGFAYTSLGDYQNARLHYRESFQLSHEQVAGTIQGLAQFVARHPSARDYMKLGLLLQEAGQNSEAASAFEHVLYLEPQLDAARSALNGLPSGGR